MFMIEPFLVTAATTTTRSTTATYLDGLGVLRYAAVNEIRPIIEPFAATNLISNSNSVTADGSTVTLTSVAATAPDGTSAATEVQGDSSTGKHTVKSLESSALTAGQRYGASIFIEKATITYSRAVVSILAGTGGSTVEVGKALVRIPAAEVVSSTGLVGADVTDCVGKWVRAELVFTAQSHGGSTNHQIHVLLDGGSADDAELTSFAANGCRIRVFGADIEADYVSSYIPTSGTAASRAADVLPAAVATVSDLISSNVPVTDHAEWNVATAYVLNDRVILAVLTSVYECRVACTGVNPSTDTTGKWVLVGRVNCWKMFDGQMTTSTEMAEEINVAIRPGAKADSLVLFGAVGAGVRVTVTDAVDGLLLDRQIAMVRHTAESSWYAYFFNPQVAQDYLILTDLPRSSNCTITVQISQPGGTAKCSMCLVGSKDDLGTAQFGLGFGIDDYSTREKDDFGNYSITKRDFSDHISYPVLVPTADNRRVKNRLAAVRATACVFVGSVDYPETIAYGYPTAFDHVLGGVGYSDCNLEVESLPNA